MRTASLIAILWAAPALAQNLSLDPPIVLLNSSEARPVKVGSPKKGQAYTVSEAPDWLRVTSANHFTAPDTLFFQLANSVCGTCEAAVKVTPAGATEGMTLTIRYNPGSAAGLSQLSVSTSTVFLNNTQARPVRVSAYRDSTAHYTASEAPPWLKVTSANNYTTPDTLYFQLAASNCGSCTATIDLIETGGDKATTITVTFDINAASTYRTNVSRVTLSYPGPNGGACGLGTMSSCAIAVTSRNPKVERYRAAVTQTGASWLLVDNAGEFRKGVPLSTPLHLSINASVAATMATGMYTAQLSITNPGDPADLAIIDVSLLLNPPGSLSITPSSGAGNSQIFTVRAPHPAGWQSLAVINVLINDGLEWRRACYMAYEVMTRSLHLTDDEGLIRGPEGALHDGQAGSVENRQCQVSQVSAKGDEQGLSVTMKLTFSPGFAGQRKIYLAARDKNQNNSGWVDGGTFEVRPPARRLAPPVGAPPRKKK